LALFLLIATTKGKSTMTDTFIQSVGQNLTARVGSALAIDRRRFWAASICGPVFHVLVALICG